MADADPVLYTFNRGIVSKLGLARTDLKRLALSAEIQDNCIPRSLGSMSLRPGWQKIGSPNAGLKSVNHPFVFSTDPAVNGLAILEFTSGALRIWQGDVPIARVLVGTAVANGTFPTDLASWTQADSGGTALSDWVTQTMRLVGDGTNYAMRYQTLTIAPADFGKVHALRIVIPLGVNVKCKIGNAVGQNNYLSETDLGYGTHSICFLPTSNATVHFYNYRTAPAFVQSVAIEGAGPLVLPTQYTEAQNHLLRLEQSANVVYIACPGVQQFKIERRQLPTDSWSIVRYMPEDGPFMNINVGPNTLAIGALSGATSLTSGANGFFNQSHVGALFRLASAGQTVLRSIAGANLFGNPIKVTGVGNDRNLLITLTGTWAGTVTLQQSIGNNAGPWTDVPSEAWVANVQVTFNDKLDNQIIYYRLGIKAGNYTSGTANVQLDFQAGSIQGICRVTSVGSDTVASVICLTDFGSLATTKDWWEGTWSSFRGFPSSVVLDTGRLTWPGRSKYIASVSDAYESFDDNVIGDAAPINRSIGSGPLDVINSAISLLQVILFAQGAEWSARSDALSAALTSTNINLKDFSTQGSAAVAAQKIDRTAVFVSRSGNRVFLVELDNVYLGIYKSSDLTILIPDFGQLRGGFTKIVVQRSPDTRIHFLMADGTVSILVFDQAEDVKCWVTASASALRPNDKIEDIVILPGVIEDVVYYQTTRRVNGADVRFMEKWAREDQCNPFLQVPLLADCFATATGPTGSISVPHLANEAVICIADGVDQGPKTADGAGNVILNGTYNFVVCGLPYEAMFKSAKLEYGAQLGSAVNQMKQIKRIGVVLVNSHAQGLQYGPDFDNLDYMPLIEDGAPVSDSLTYWPEYDDDQFSFDGTWTTDSRICLRMAAPRAVTISAVSISMETNE